MILKGSVIGVGCLVPGISAGTLALIMGVYEQIISSINSLWPVSGKTKPALIFLLCLAGGTGAGIFLPARGISFLLNQFPVELYWIFTGLIVASLPQLFKLTDRTKKSFLIACSTALIFFVVLRVMGGGEGGPEWEGRLFLLFFISGFLGCFASVLPGVSGSAVLLILGSYPTILKSLTEGPSGQMGLFLAGGLLGFVCAFYFVRFLLNKKKNLFFCVALGLILGSLPEVFPQEQWQATVPIGQAILNTLIFTGLGAGLFFLVAFLGCFSNCSSSKT